MRQLDASVRPGWRAIRGLPAGGAFRDQGWSPATSPRIRAGQDQLQVSPRALCAASD